MYSYYITYGTNTNSENNYCVYIDNMSIKYIFVAARPVLIGQPIYSTM